MSYYGAPTELILSRLYDCAITSGIAGSRIGVLTVRNAALLLDILGNSEYQIPVPQIQYLSIVDFMRIVWEPSTTSLYVSVYVNDNTIKGALFKDSLIKSPKASGTEFMRRSLIGSHRNIDEYKKASLEILKELKVLDSPPF